MILYRILSKNPEIEKFRGKNRFMQRIEVGNLEKADCNFVRKCLEKFSENKKFHENISKYCL